MNKSYALSSYGVQAELQALRDTERIVEYDFCPKELKFNTANKICRQFIKIQTRMHQVVKEQIYGAQKNNFHLDSCNVKKPPSTVK